jgi:hypothetical protein
MGEEGVVVGHVRVVGKEGQYYGWPIGAELSAEVVI